MNNKELQNHLHNGQRVYGTLIVSTSPRWPTEVKKLNLDFVFIDTEHMSIDRDMLSWMCRAYTASGLAPIVRIPSPDPYEASKAMDAGAAGIVAPYIETPEQVQALRGAVKLRPIKGKKLGNILSETDKPVEPLKSYLEEFNSGNILIVNIESGPALEALDEILQVPQLDGVLIGPHDLSCSLNVPEQYDHPVFKEAVSTIIRKARAANVAAGIHYFWGVEQEIAWGQEGMNLFVHASDMTAFTAQMSRDINEIKQRLGDRLENADNRIHI
ncbi:HpcH/HpaI aldolase/citrate lyase family protein [Paenibacillus sp. GCM10023248]|uniref:HpcH/HpaI aldolase family protein n=1 Tax=unclassified Paenibacillus TaxID=185978 RepID=UPI002378D439|nr:aldolase/citrate lyase family protein [Paenibacillus sp. MAHUQ-63]MDD9269571.1 aldolase/citrate lyase family protein [Paenibacillus sp. MAHUQ-63]